MEVTPLQDRFTPQTLDVLQHVKPQGFTLIQIGFNFMEQDGMISVKSAIQFRLHLLELLLG